ncbi:hypothetical protein LCGC14_0572940 [marine sediment metagenome]|uniref:Uncharacterized protein n=1 Tax=marine sediment metagenome TaxID=412755 RepID=A0A0F9URX5_9ZZZZ
MSELKVFSNSVDFVIADSVGDAISLLPYAGEDVYEDEWGAESMDGKFSIWLDLDGEVAEHGVGDLIERSWEEWIKTFGKGYLCKTEY